jgi:hypothetical protein
LKEEGENLMKKLKQIWANDLGKLILSISGILLLFLSLLIQPGMTYFFGDEITVRVYQGDQSENILYQLLEINQIPLNRFDEALREMLEDPTLNDYEITRNDTVYAIFDTDSQISTVQLVTLARPSSDSVYLKVDYLRILRDPNFESPTSSTLVHVAIIDLEDALYRVYLDLTKEDDIFFSDVRLRIRNNHFIVIPND